MWQRHKKIHEKYIVVEMSTIFSSDFTYTWKIISSCKDIEYYESIFLFDFFDKDHIWSYQTNYF